LYTGENVTEIKTEAAGDDTTECPYDDFPTNRTFGIFLILHSLHSFLIFASLYKCKKTFYNNV